MPKAAKPETSATCGGLFAIASSIPCVRSLSKHPSRFGFLLAFYIMRTAANRWLKVPACWESVLIRGVYLPACFPLRPTPSHVCNIRYILRLPFVGQPPTHKVFDAVESKVAVGPVICILITIRVRHCLLRLLFGIVAALGTALILLYVPITRRICCRVRDKKPSSRSGWVCSCRICQPLQQPHHFTFKLGDCQFRIG